jgi:transcriptional regulator with XRE-family HTH domain
MENIGKKLKGLREAMTIKRCPTVQEVAKETKLNSRVIRNIEDGKREISTTELMTLADHYGVDPAILLKGEGVGSID